MRSRIVFWIIGAFSICNASILHSQENLVQNGSFEDYEKCRTTRTYVDRNYLCDFWYMPWGTSDHFSDCARGSVSSKLNFAGREDARTGNAYAGAISGHCSGGGCGSEMIENELASPLEKDQLYYITFFVSLADGSGCHLNYLEVSFFDKRIKRSKTLISHEADIIICDTQALTVSEGWARLSGTYKAKGGESLMVIGNFAKQNNTANCIGAELSDPPGRFREASGDSYYFFDDVSLVKLNGAINFREDVHSLGNSSGIGPIESGQTEDEVLIILRNIEFETGESRLKESSFLYLDTLAHQLTTKPHIYFNLVGHTDSIGVESTNQKLSESRATAVMEYLIKSGVQSERIRAYGKGESAPIGDNSTKVGRARNRRIELIIIK